MKKAKFVQDAKLDPARYYRNPSDVIRDRRLSNRDRLDILAAWERDARDRRDRDVSANENDELRRLQHLREELERNPESAGADVPRAEDA